MSDEKRLLAEDGELMLNTNKGRVMNSAMPFYSTLNPCHVADWLSLLPALNRHH
jgi:hypothetical protein